MAYGSTKFSMDTDTDTVVDLRSDTVTKPDLEMREVMSRAEVGDDVMDEDPSINALQKEAAELLGKEAALFVPSGTMSNLIAVLNHCQGRGQEIITGEKSHIYKYEQGGAAQFGGVHIALIPNLPDGTFDLTKLKSLNKAYDQHFPITSLVCIENTHNMMGGKILPMDWLDELGSVCKTLKLPIHLDGARLLNAAAALNLPPSSLTKHCDSVSLCLSKGLGAPVGSVLVGSTDFIKRAHRLRKALGGGMRQAGILAAAGSLALTRYQKTLSTDHSHAASIVKAVDECGSKKVRVCKPVHTNIILLDCDGVSPDDLQERLDKSGGCADEVRVRSFAINERQVRLVTHCGLTQQAVSAACKKITAVIQGLV